MNNFSLVGGGAFSGLLEPSQNPVEPEEKHATS